MDGKTMVVYRAAGNHSNRLFQAVHFESFCLEHGFSFYNPSFSDMAKLYNIKANWLDKPYCWAIIALRRIKLIKTIDFDSVNDYESNSMFAFEGNNVFVSGWNFKVHSLTKKYQKYFIEKYELSKDIATGNSLLWEMKKFQSQGGKLVGVHIRRGDYKSWENGKFFFNDSTYESAISKMRNELVKKKQFQTKFILFSDEEISLSLSQDCLISKNPWYIDHYLMTYCDFLIGPPSTFTLWASYIGKVPYFHIMNPLPRDIDIGQFKYCYG